MTGAGVWQRAVCVARASLEVQVVAWLCEGAAVRYVMTMLVCSRRRAGRLDGGEMVRV